MKNTQHVLPLKKIKHDWTVEDVMEYFDFIDEHQFLTISSPLFYLDETTNYGFFLKMTFFSRSISCSLHPCPNTTFGSLKCGLSLLYKGKRVLKSKNFKIDHSNFISRTSEDLAKLVFNSSTLLSDRSDLFNSKSAMKVSCVLTLLDDSAKIQPIYITKAWQPMKNHYKELLESENSSDVTFEVEGKKFKVHKLILKARSPVFAAMFEHDMIEKKTNQVKIIDISKTIFDLLLHFIYTDEIKISLDVETGMNLLQAASKYQLDGLQNLCETQLINMITVNNAGEIRAIAEAHGLMNFVKSIEAFIKSHPK